MPKSQWTFRKAGCMPLGLWAAALTKAIQSMSCIRNTCPGWAGRNQTPKSPPPSQTFQTHPL